MKQFADYIDGFFFRKISASGFGLMRISWGFVVFTAMLMAWPDVIRYYTDSGIMPGDLGHLVFRSDYRFTLLDIITDNQAVILLYFTLLYAAFCTMIGVWPRLMTIVTVVLLTSFHERNLQPLGGGDTVLRNIGYLLMIAPELRAFSVERLSAQWKNWKESRSLLSPLRMSMWPYRLLLWQLLIIYITSGIDKLTGTMWLDGTAVAATLHHTHFTRLPKEWMDVFSVVTPFIGVFFILYEFTWAFLLIPKPLARILPAAIRRHSLKRWLILCGVTLHGGIAIMMEVGSFSFAMMTLYLGLLLDEDWTTFRTFLNRRWRGDIAVLYDGICRLCRRSMFTLQILDPLRRLKPVDFRNPAERSATAPELKLEDLDRALHIKLQDGSTRQGFFAFRTLCWHLPVLWPLVPLLYIPGVAPVGELIYSQIAARRDKCADGVCKHR